MKNTTYMLIYSEQMQVIKCKWSNASDQMQNNNLQKVNALSN